MGPKEYHPLGGCGDMSEGERMALEAMDEEACKDPAELEEQMALDRLDHIYAPVGVWNATSGHVPMTAMTDEHVKNALAWLARYDLGDTEKAAELRAEQRRRAKSPSAPATGRAAQMSVLAVEYLSGALASENVKGDALAALLTRVEQEALEAAAAKADKVADSYNEEGRDCLSLERRLECGVQARTARAVGASIRT